MSEETRRIIDGVNNEMAKEAAINPESQTFICSEYGQAYVAESVADLYVCPLCGGVQHNPGEGDGEE